MTSSSRYYPVALDLRDRPCLVVGGGAVAEAKVEGLLFAEARVTVVSPAVSQRLTSWATESRIAYRQRNYDVSDLDGHQLIFSATDRRDVTLAVAADARQRGLWVNAADEPECCDFLLPSVLRRGRLQVAVSTGGASPALAARVRRDLESYFTPEYEDLVELAAEVRYLLRASGRRANAATWRIALDGDLRRLLAEGRRGDARARLLDRLGGDGVRPGRVCLVGAGPGDPGLLTVRALERLREADVVVYDRLVSPALLDEAPSGALRIFAGKRVGSHCVAQAAINALLVHHAEAGRFVVRLKGGDPFVFGRGGEEALALSEAGIAFEVVPGVSSAIAVPAYAGIPVTHRGVASSFAVLTGHEDPSKDGDAVDWPALATAVDTLVVLMAVSSFPRIAGALLAHGRPPETPVALIRWGTTEAQEVRVGTLADIVERARGLEPPVVAVIGEVVRLRERLHWAVDVATTLHAL